MEQHRLPRRSASHGTLHSGYACHGRLLHKPLRSVNENSALFPSPGPLESMLKTTTETGDIGIFSIKSVPSSTNLGLPLGARHPMEVNGRKTPLASRIEDHYRQDHRKGMPGFGDTTSEILSMYGSTSQSSVTSTLAPSMDEFGRRSYSMTTCASGHPSRNKSAGTFRSHASGGLLQRPRSPFPYPTRLRRPGARPASPAVTENGLVDYSRMVEIDRISLRTVHGSYKPYYPHPAPRPPPLGIRSDANLSTPSLMCQGTPPMQYLQPRTASLRTVSVASTVSRKPEQRERFNCVASRTSSLTSVVNMYQRMPSAFKAAQIGSTARPPRYYDYTEQFEVKEIRPTTPVEPIAPIPTRAASIQKPLVLREGTEEQLAAALGLEAESTLFDDESQADDSLRGSASGREDHDEQVELTGNSTEQAPGSKRSMKIGIAISSDFDSKWQAYRSDIDLLPSQIGRISADTFNPSPDLKSRQSVLIRFPRYPIRTTSQTEAASPSPARQVQVHGHTTFSIRSQKGSIKETHADGSDEDQDGESSTKSETENAGAVIGSHSTQYPQAALKGSSTSTAESRQRLSSETRREPSTTASDSQPAVLDEKLEGTIIPRLLDHGTTRQTEEDLKTRKPAPSTEPIDKSQSQALEKHNQRAYEKDHESGAKDMPKTSIDIQPPCPRHKRNQAVLKIDTKDLTAYARELAGIARLSPSASTVSLYSPKPISPARELKVKSSIPHLMKALPPIPTDADNASWSMLTSHDDDEFTEVLQPFRLSRSSTPKASSVSQRPQTLQKKLAKIKQKRESRPWNSDNNYPWANGPPDFSLDGSSTADGDHSLPRAKFKLRIGRLTQTDARDADTVRRHPDARKPEILAELAGLKAKDFFSSFRLLGSSQRKMTPAAHSERSTKEPAVRDNVLVGKVNVRSFSSGSAFRRKHPRHARKSLSNLRWLLVKTTKEQSEIVQTEEAAFSHSHRTRIESLGSRSINYDGATIGSERSSRTDAPRRQCFRRRVRRRLSSWLRRTRAAMRKNRQRNVPPPQGATTSNA